MKVDAMGVDLNAILYTVVNIIFHNSILDYLFD